jgi:hypothetical protein
MGEHALARGVKLATDIPKHRLLPAFVTHARNPAILEQLVEDASVGSVEVVFARNALLSHVLIRLGRVYLFSRHVEIARQHDAFANLCEIADASVQRSEEAVTKVVSQAIAVGRAVDAKKHKGWELKHQTATFGIEGGRVNAQGSHLGGRRIAAYGGVFRQFSIWSGRTGRTEHT